MNKTLIYHTTDDIITIAAVVNDVVILNVDEAVKDNIVRVIVKFTIMDRLMRTETIPIKYDKSGWIHIPATIIQRPRESSVTIQVSCIAIIE